ncbi:MAG: efflux RND transporter permease subunit, partial [Opitutales bacterium]|nr:efflux RND transporter permease subunit [Opitutales bacterium]
QNKQVAAGSLNKPPLETGAAYELLINAQGRLSTEKEFGEIVVKYMPDGRIIHLRDIARIELGAYTYENESLLNMKPAVSFAMYQLPGANSVETVDRIFKELDDIKKTFPTGVDYQIGYNATEYVRESISAVYRSIIEAVILVVIVVLVFLRNLRAAVIPLFAIPVSLVGTFAMMYVAGFTINNLTLFGLVLAIGIVVDDAIVVVENVERNMAECSDVKTAVRNAMTQIQGALIAIVLVLSAAFVPTAFLGGISGQFYRQFALTIATSTIISGLVSLTLTPALCALLLKPEGAEKRTALALAWKYTLGLPIAWFNAFFNWVSEIYGKSIRHIVKFSPLFILFYAAMIWATVEIFKETPRGFIPKQDCGFFSARFELPQGASFERTSEVMHKAGRALYGIEGAQRVIAIIGDYYTNIGRASFKLADRHKRDKDGNSLDVVMERAKKIIDANIIGAKVNFYTPAVVPGMASGGDLKFMLQDRAGLGQNTIERYAKLIVEEVEKLPCISSAYTTFKTTNPQLYIDIDRERAQKLNVPISSIFTTMQYNLGSVYVNDFNILGRVYRVMVQAESNRRKDISDIYRLKIPNALGQNVPLGSVAKIRRYVGPNNLVRYNLYMSAEVYANVAQRYSTGEAMREIEKLAARILPQGMGIEWTDIAYEEKKTGDSSIYIFAICVLFVFLLLSALYESWLLPLSVILIVPVVILFAMIGINLGGFSNNLMAQIGFVALIGLACKNAILIVEFAKQGEDEGKDLVTALATASQNRLRPIMMTSLAFIFGVVPLAFGQGPACELRQPLGTSVMYGMIGVTAMGCLMTPVFYYVIRRIFGKPKLAPKI